MTGPGLCCRSSRVPNQGSLLCRFVLCCCRSNGFLRSLRGGGRLCQVADGPRHGVELAGLGCHPFQQLVQLRLRHLGDGGVKAALPFDVVKPSSHDGVLVEAVQPLQLGLGVHVLHLPPPPQQLVLQHDVCVVGLVCQLPKPAALRRQLLQLLGGRLQLPQHAFHRAFRAPGMPNRRLHERGLEGLGKGALALVGQGPRRLIHHEDAVQQVDALGHQGALKAKAHLLGLQLGQPFAENVQHLRVALLKGGPLLLKALLLRHRLGEGSIHQLQLLLKLLLARLQA
mmetsp:Transcript_21203/g.58880  ORF Transcript_21203/g.58880 Transcript_21203/m.58880 type:complete len:284 (-) Transcript_21203:1832-2683(-)